MARLATLVEGAGLAFDVAVMLVLAKCYDIKMVLLPLYLFITSLIKPEATNQKQKKLDGYSTDILLVDHSPYGLVSTI